MNLLFPKVSLNEISAKGITRHVVGVIMIVLCQNLVFGQCPQLTTDEATYCDLVTIQTVTFRIEEDANDCFDATQPGSNTMEFDFSSAGFQFIANSATFFIDPSGDLTEITTPAVTNTSSLITISNLATQNGGNGRDNHDFIEVTVQVQSTILGSTAAVRRSGGNFTIFGSVGIPASSEALVTLSSDVQSLSNNDDVVQNANNMSLGAEDQDVLQIPIEMSGSACPWSLIDLTVDYMGDDPNDVGKLKLYYTGTSNVFGTDNLVAEEVGPGASSTLSGLQFLQVGTNYFWLAVDLSGTASSGNKIDYDVADYNLDDNGSVTGYVNGVDFDGAPGGEREIVPFVGTTFTVGNSGDHNTIQTAYDAVPNGPTEPHLLEILGDYDPSLESFPLDFPDKGTTSSNFITIRPALGVTGIEVTGDPGGGVGLIKYDGADYVNFDGRPGGVGTDREIIIRNERTAGGRGAIITLENDAIGNTFKFVALESETNAAVSGMVDILDANVEGNNLNEFVSCLFTDLTTGGSGNRPGVGVYSNDGSGAGNNGMVVESCEFVDVWDAGNVNSWAIQIFNNSSDWEVRDNHFYEDQPFAGISFNSGFFYTDTGSDYIVENNFIGGKSMFAGGGQMVISSGVDPLDVIYFGSGVADGTCIIRGNTITNLKYTNTHSVSNQFPFSGIYCDGSAEFIIESNTIGDFSIAKELEINNNGSDGEMFVGIYTGSNTGACQLFSNTIAGVLVDGTRNGAAVNLIDTRSTTADISIIGNTIGGLVAKSVEIKPNVAFRGIDNTAGGKIIIEGNTFQNIEQGGAGGSATIINNNGGSTLNCINNTLNDNLFALNGTIRCIASIDASTEVNISNNEISAFSQTGGGGTTLVSLIYANSGMNVRIDSNSIGGSAADDISCAAGNDIKAIEKQGAGTLFLAQGDTIRNMTSTSNSATANIIGIQNNGANSVMIARNNVIQDIEANSSASGTPALVGIDCNNSGNGHNISNNTIERFDLVNSGSNNAIVAAIEVGGGIGQVSANFIKDIENVGTGTTDAIIGVYANGSGTWIVINNVVFLENNAYATNIDIDGIQFSGTTNGTIHHNAVFIEGNSGGGLDATSGINDISSGALSLNNNALINLRSGGVGNYAIRTNGGAFNNDYNYLEVAEDQNKVGYNGSALGFVNWQTATSSFNSRNGIGEVFSAIGGFTDAFIGKNTGVDLTGTVDFDFNGEARDANPWMGAYEGDGIPFSLVLPDESGAGFGLQLDGNDYVSMGAPVTTNINDVTIETWFKWNGAVTGSDQMILMNGNNGSSGYGVFLKSGSNEIQARLGGVGSWTSTIVPEVDKWMHIALVGTPLNSWQIFVNGVPKGISYNGTANVPATNFTIGANHVGAFDFNGEVDEVRVWNTTLTQAEIRDWMCQKINESHSSIGDLSNLWVMDEGAGTTLVDYAGTADGSFLGSAPLAGYAYSGAYIGDSSIHNYIDISDLTLMSPFGGTMTLKNLDTDIDSLHLYYVADTTNDLTVPVGVDSLDKRNYWGIFHAGLGPVPIVEAELNYSAHPDINGHVNEAQTVMAGRQDNSTTVAWGLPSNPASTTINTTSNLLTVDTVDALVEIIAAFASPSCDTTSSTTGTWTWDGGVSTDWFDCANWDMGSLPNSQVDVLIPGGTTFDPLISIQTGYCRSIDIDVDNAAILNLDSDSGGRLEVGP